MNQDALRELVDWALAEAQGALDRVNGNSQAQRAHELRELAATAHVIYEDRAVGDEVPESYR